MKTTHLFSYDHMTCQLGSRHLAAGSSHLAKVSSDFFNSIRNISLEKTLLILQVMENYFAVCPVLGALNGQVQLFSQHLIQVCKGNSSLEFKPTYIHTYIYFLLRQVGLRQPKGWWGPARNLIKNYL